MEVARSNGAYGARMTGGGFGGSIIALVDKGQSRQLAEKNKKHSRRVPAAAGTYLSSISAAGT